MKQQHFTPAFPCPMIPIGTNDEGFTEVRETGMTLLDWFAGKALGGDLAGETEDWGFGLDHEKRAAFCYDVAAAMMNEKLKRESSQ